MVVITQSPAKPGLGRLDPPISATGVYPPNQARIHQAGRDAGNWANVQPAPRGIGRGRFDPGLSRFGYRGLRGLGAIDSVPEPVLWGGGAAVAGLVLGYLLFKK